MDRTSKAIQVIQRHVSRIVESLDVTDYFTLLDVPLDATPQQVRQSFRSIVGAYRVVLRHESCPGSLGNDIWAVCQRLAVAVRTLCDEASRAAHVAQFNPAPRPPDAPPYNPVRLRPDQQALAAGPDSDILINYDLEDATAEITEDPTRPYGNAGHARGEDTEVDPSLPLFGGAKVQPLSGSREMPLDDSEPDVLEEIATITDPKLPAMAQNDCLGAADTELLEPVEGTATAVDSPLQALDGEPVLEPGEDPLSPLDTEVEEPTDLERGVPFGLHGAEPGDDER